jgi:hypothetical protein
MTRDFIFPLCFALLSGLALTGCSKARCADPGCGPASSPGQSRMSSGHYRIELAVDALAPHEMRSAKHRVALSLDTTRMGQGR